MAPVSEQLIEDLKNTVHRLESRVQDLEGRLSGDGKKSSAGESVRMILMGPPGAGELREL